MDGGIDPGVDPQRALAVLLRNDLPSFIQRSFQTVAPGQRFLRNWHIEAIAHRLEQCRAGASRRLIITLPPRNLKSVCASVAFPAFVLGHDPSTRIVCVSYSDALAARHSRDCKAVMESSWYRALFPRTRIDPRKNTETEFDTTARGHRLATSVGGTLTGRGGNLIVIDDPMKPGEAISEAKREAVKEWYDGTLLSRLDSKTEGVIVLIMQRLHVDDLVGHVLEQPGWDHLDLPAIAVVPQAVPLGGGRVHNRATGELLHPAREPQSVLHEIKAGMGSQMFSAQYQQAPVPPGGALVKRDWFGTYRSEPDRRGTDQIVQSWDTASKAGTGNDWSVCTTWLMRGKDHYLLDVLRARLEYPDLKRRIAAHADRHSARTVLIEDAGSGTHLIQELKRDGPVRPIGIRPEGDKIVRLEAQTPTIEAGHVFLPEAAAWLDDFLAEIMAFPYGKFDDQVDSVSQYLHWATTRRRFDPAVALAIARLNLELTKESSIIR